MSNNKRDQFEDRTPANTPYEGDLAYGRTYRGLARRDDFVAERNAITGVALNPAIIQRREVVVIENALEGVRRPDAWLKRIVNQRDFQSKIAQEMDKSVLGRSLSKFTMKGTNQKESFILNS